MSAETLEAWFRSGKPIGLNGHAYKLLGHSHLPGTPLCVSRGQAAVYFLQRQDGVTYVLKKFHASRALNRTYLDAISAVLPSGEAFSAGSTRRVLFRQDLKRAWRHYYSPVLAAWVDGTVLGPKIAGVDWAGLADEVREGRRSLSQDQRLALARGLAQVVEQLEQQQCCHRDLSAGNVFVDEKDWKTHLIDFDSAFHASLAMPATTTAGTSGYVAPWTWRAGGADPAASWRPRADRFPLALLVTEFLLIRPRAPMTAEGGMFDQSELLRRSGKHLEQIRGWWKAEFPGGLGLFDAAINASSFDGCPSPADWHCWLATVPPSGAPADIMISRAPVRDYVPATGPGIAAVAPELTALPTNPWAPMPPVRTVTLPDDPWSS